MKLDVGGGKKRRKGYTSIDVGDYGNNIVGDFRTMKFEDVSVVRSFFLLEHYSRKEAITVLQQWHSWLKDEGTLWIAVPDFEYICKNFDIHPYWMTRHTFGSQGEDSWGFHLDGWYEDKIKKLFPALGFEIFEIKRFVSRKYLPNIEVLAKKVEPNPEALERYLNKYPN
ncbi:MAG TPA: hypothetical protein ENI23_13850 [bacterium]|nr:hypothetical protein [bacterium]